MRLQREEVESVHMMTMAEILNGADAGGTSSCNVILHITFAHNLPANALTHDYYHRHFITQISPKSSNEAHILMIIHCGRRAQVMLGVEEELK